MEAVLVPAWAKDTAFVPLVSPVGNIDKLVNMLLLLACQQLLQLTEVFKAFVQPNIQLLGVTPLLLLW